MPKLKPAADLPVGLKEEAPAVEAPASKRYKVELRHGPTLTIDAADASAAWAEYMRQTNLIATEHTPALTEVLEG